MIPLDPHESVACWHYSGPPGHTFAECCCCIPNPCELVTEQHAAAHRRWEWQFWTQEEVAS